MSISINRIYYDRFKRKIHLWETIDGKRYSDVIDHTVEFYVDDPTKQSSIRDIYGRPVVKKIAKEWDAAQKLRTAGIYTCESDLMEEVKFLHSRYEGRQVRPNIRDFNICYLDIEVAAEKEFPTAALAKYPINLITVKLSRTGQTYTFGLQPYTGEAKRNYKWFETEKELLEYFMLFFNRAKVDIISGWNVEGFDIPYIINRCNNIGAEGCLSPIGKYWQNRKTMQWSIPAIAVLDYMRFFMDMKFVQKKMASYRLDYVCKEVLDRGKLQYEGSINDLWKNDWNKFVDYNVVDTELVELLEDKKKFIELAINICHDSLIPLEKVFSAVTVIEGVILSELHAENIVMPDKKEGVPVEDLPGAYVESKMGFYRDVVSYDFESLYPNMMIHYNISPDTLVMFPTDKTDLIKTPLSEEFGIYYKKEMGFLTKIVQKKFKERKEFKAKMLEYKAAGEAELAAYYKSQQEIRKVFLNSIYGVLSNEWFHFYNINTAKTVTLSGQHLIKFMRDKINEYFNDYFYKNPKYFAVIDEANRTKRNRIVNLDTDSLFIALDDIKAKVGKDKTLLEWANEFNDELLTPLFNKLLDGYFAKFSVQNKIKFKIEKICTQMAMFGDKGKNYANTIISDEGVVYDSPQLYVAGFASKRSTTPTICRKYIDETLKCLFESPVKSTIIEKIRDARTIFFNAPIEDISSNKNVTDYYKYAIYDEHYYLENGLTYEKKTPMHLRAAMVYNCFITKYNLPYEPIRSGSKIKYVYVRINNEFNTDVIGYMGECPKEIKEKFKVNLEEQFQVEFVNKMQTIFDTMGWGQIDIDTVDISYMFDFE